jgi:putative ABC transport system ATP-binding protein
MMNAILETKTVSKIYDTGSNEVRAVDNVSVKVYPGDFVALVGPSGSGKTTMLALMAALLDPSEGNVIINGQDLDGMRESDRVKFRRERIGFTFQSNNLVPFLTVRENVELMLRLNHQLDKAGKDKTLEILSRLGLEDRMNSLPSQLSGGQKQRVAIARALIHQPSLVLADEPTASLDTERAFQVTEILADLIHEQERAGIMVTHDLRMVQYADKVFQMMDGKLTNVVTNRDEIRGIAGMGAYANSFPAETAKIEAPQNDQPISINIPSFAEI